MALAHAQIVSHLRSTLPFADFPDGELQAIAALVQEQRYPANTIIFRQGELPLALYIVASGQVRESAVDGAGRVVYRKAFGQGECFGCYALVRGQPQHATARAVGDVVLLQIPTAEFDRLQAQYPQLRERLLPSTLAGRLRAMPVFGSLADQAVLNVAHLIEEQAAEPGRVILRAGERDTPLYLIRSGQVQLGGTGGERVLTAGNFFGEESVLLNRTSSVSATALTPVELYALPAEDFRWLLGAYPDLRDALEHPDIVGRLQGTSTFAKLTPEQIRHLAGYVRWVHYPRGYMVTSQGHPGANFFILDRGEAIIRSVDSEGRERPRGRRQAGESFGETSLFVGDLRDASVEAITDTDWLVLHREDFKLAQAARSDIKGRLQLRPETRQRLDIPSFSWLQNGEIVVEQVRRHIIVAVQNLLLPVVLAVILLVVLVGGYLPRWLVWILLALDAVYGLWSYVDWRNDYLVITSQRVTHQEQVWPVSERRVEAPLRQVQDVNVTRSLIGNLLNYGQLQIQTAAPVGLIAFTYTPEPMRVKDLIMDRVARARAGEQAERRESVRQSLDRRLEMGLELRAPERAVPSGVAPGDQTARRFDWRSLRFWPWLRREGPDGITWRKHWFRLLLRAWLPFLVCAALVILAIAVGWRRIPLIPSEPVFWLPWFVVTFVAFFWLWWEYTDWGNDVYIVTNDRIIDVEKKPLFFAEERREASLGMVQNVTADIPGPLAYLFNYGHVLIYTAAEIGRFDFMYVSNPREVQAEIFRRIERYRTREAQRQARQRQAEMAEWFEMYHRFTAGRP